LFGDGLMLVFDGFEPRQFAFGAGDVFARGGDFPAHEIHRFAQLFRALTIFFDL
jgi:hypothetical protein